MTTKQRSLLIKIMVSIFILVVLFRRINSTTILFSWSQLDFKLVTLAVSIIPITYLIRFIKWNVLVSLEKKVSFIDTSKIYAVGLFISVLTPAKLGDMVKYIYLKKHDIPSVRGLSLSLVDRALDLIVLVTLSVIGIFFFHFTDEDEFVLIFFVSVLAILFSSFILFFFFPNMGNPIKKLILALLKNSSFFTKMFTWIQEKFTYFVRRKDITGKNSPKYALNQILIPLKKLRQRKMTCIILVGMSFFVWYLLALHTVLLLHAFGYNLPIIQVMCCLGIGAVSGLIPFTFAGIGVREATIMILFISFGIPDDVALLVPMLYTFFSYLIPVGLASIAYIKEK